MKVDRISYKKIFPIQSYVNETIGVEIQLDDTDDWEESFSLAKRMVEKFHKDNNPQLTEAELPIERPPYFDVCNAPPIVLKSIDRKAIERLEILIDDCKTEESLYHLHEEAGRLGLTEIYNTKLNQLKNI
jgi:hypothetical protein